MKKLLINLIGGLLSILVRIYRAYKREVLYSKFIKIGSNVSISNPNFIQGHKNIIIEDNVYIGPMSTITSINAKVLIKKWTVIGPFLYISTGDHMSIPGRFISTVTNSEKGKGFDGDVLIEEDVWIGARVIILKGVKVGRGAIIAAGAVVNKSVLPYSVVAGVPARFIKFKWDTDTIRMHESQLYEEHDRLSKEELIKNVELSKSR